MPDLILGQDWLGPVHHLDGRPFASGPAERRTIVGALRGHAEAIPHAPFLTETGTEARGVTYAQAFQAVRLRAALLLATGLARGDRVGVIGPNSIAFALAVLAVLEAGGVAVLLNHKDPAARTAAQIEFAQVGTILFDPDCEPCAGNARTLSFTQLESLSRQYDPVPLPAPAATDAGLIFYTSGTTGVPKAVVQSHFAIAHNAWSLTDHHRIRPGMSLLCVLPMHHVNGLEFTVFGVMLGGGHTVVSQGFDGLRFWPTIRQHRIEIASMVPNLIRLLVSRPEFRGKEPTSLRYLVSAAAPLSLEIAQQAWDRLGLRIIQGYGLSEVANKSCLLPIDLTDADYRRWMLQGRRTSIGPALPNQDVDVHVATEPAAPGIDGEIVIRGHSVMSGYLHNPTATEEAFRGGWFHSGDVGYYLPENDGRKFFHISGRIKEIAKRGGAMVSLLELDELLAKIPGVADAGAASFPNDWVDEEIAAVIVRHPDAALTEDAILQYCRNFLPFASMPKRIEFVDEVPRTASGKIRRGELAGRFAALQQTLFREPRSVPAPAREDTT